MFTQLTCWSDRTLHHSILTPARIADVAAQAGIGAVGLADRGTLSGVPEFMSACRYQGIKPLVGEQFWVGDPVSAPIETVTDMDGKLAGGWVTRPGVTVTLLAATLQGWLNLVWLHNQGFGALNLDLVKGHTSGLVCLTGGLSGPVMQPASDGEASENLSRLVEAFGVNRVFVEVQSHGVEQGLFSRCSRLAAEHNVGLVATNECRHTNTGDRRVLDAVMAGKQGRLVTDNRAFRLPGTGWHLRSEQETRGLWASSPLWQEAVDRANWVGEQCQDWELPAAPCLVGGSDCELGGRVQAGLDHNYPDDQEAAAQAEHEVETIQSMGFTSYMLAAADLIGWAKTQGILVGPGRGSSVASLVAHLLGVTDIDPLAAGLSFERFLEPADPKPPDIDVDVQKSRVGEVTARLRSMVGAVRLSVPQPAGGKPLASMIGATIPDGDTEYADQVEAEWAGCVTSVAAHPCGWIVGDTSSIPMRADGLTDWDGDSLETLGFLKLDVLSSVALDVCAIASQGVEPGDGLGLLRAGQLTGVFQLESDQARRITVGVQPDSVGMVAACVALNRPGPLSAHQDVEFVDRRQGRSQVVNPWTSDPGEAGLLGPVVGDTLGMILYQEQVMALAGVVAGFDAGERARLRHAMSGKDQATLGELGELFLARGQTRFQPATVQGVWRAMRFAGSYMFNKAHAVAYATLTMRMAGLKTGDPGRFAAATLACTPDKDQRLVLLRGFQRESIQVVPPFVNMAGVESTSRDGVVVLGLTEVRGVGSMGAMIVAERQQHGLFTSLRDAMDRCPRVTRDAWRGLVEAGVFDEFGPRLGQMMVIDTPEVEPPGCEWGPVEAYAHQARALRYSVDPSLLDTHRTAITSWLGGCGLTPLGVAAARRLGNNANVTVVGVLSDWVTAETKTGDDYARFTLDGVTASIQGVVWSETLQQVERLGVPPVGSVVVVEGRVRHRRRDDQTEPQVTASSVMVIPLEFAGGSGVDAPLVGWGQVDDADQQPDGGRDPESAVESLEPVPEPAPKMSMVTVAPCAASIGVVTRLGETDASQSLPGMPAQLSVWLFAHPKVTLSTPDGQCWTFGDPGSQDLVFEDWPNHELRGVSIPQGVRVAGL
ncbi:MAG: PHP domain-containing protein [Propionibacteriaceae bacterium]|jgi:DNA polymerase-3 subunit alpha|nr:PHP domain-containing protein [Propionibacteriaceae bacterium]